MRTKPKRHTLRFNLEHRETFDLVRNRKKKVETRAATVRYRNIKAGDRVTFVCGKDRFSRTVAKAIHFRTIPKLFSAYSVKDVNPTLSTKAQLISRWHSFPNYKEKIAKYGLMAIEFK